jgi:hypothetical protein
MPCPASALTEPSRRKLRKILRKVRCLITVALVKRKLWRNVPPHVPLDNGLEFTKEKESVPFARQWTSERNGERIGSFRPKSVLYFVSLAASSSFDCRY